jgi:phosphatidylinositol 4-kinase A
MVPPVTAISFFERRFRNDPFILQYAHRVLEQHHVDLTFFFVPQVVQALRYDDLGKLSCPHPPSLLLSVTSLLRLRFEFHL